jgi:hypothetical protein
MCARLLPLWTRVCVLMLGVSLALVNPVSAQTRRAAGPFSGLFGGGTRGGNAQALNVRGSLFGIWQNIVVPDTVDRTQLDPLFIENSTFTGASGTMSYTYSRQTTGTSFIFDGTGSLAEYSIQPEQPQVFSSVMTGLSTKLTRRISFTSGAGLAFSPYLGFLQGVPSPSDLASASAPLITTAAVSAPNFNGNVTAGLSYGLTKHSSLTVDTFWNSTFVFDFPEASTNSWQTHVNYNYSITSKINVHAGYFRGQLGVGDSRTTTQGFDFGANYGDALRLQLTRHTVFTLSPSLSVAVSPIDLATHIAATGSADLEHSFRRTWSSRLSYVRTLGVSPGFQDLVLADTVSAGLNGQLNRRTSSVTTASWTNGQVGFGDSSASQYGALASYSLSSVLSIGLGRRVGAFVQYSYFKSEVPAGISTLPFLSDFARQSALVGLSLFAPVYNSQRTRQ